MKKEALVNILTILPAESNSMLDNLSDAEKVGVTFLVSAEILAVTLVGYRFSDGVKNRVEKYGWKIALPVINFTGAAILLGQMWT